jgi:hypothetical protein
MQKAKEEEKRSEEKVKGRMRRGEEKKEKEMLGSWPDARGRWLWLVEGPPSASPTIRLIQMNFWLEIWVIRDIIE